MAENPYRAPQHVDDSSLDPNRWLWFVLGFLGNGLVFAVVAFWTFQRFLLAVLAQVVLVIVGFMRVRDKQMRRGFFFGVFVAASLISGAMALFYGMLVLLGF